MFNFKQIPVPTDFSKVAGAALTSACELAERMSGEVFLLHVVVPAAVLPPLEVMPLPADESDNAAQINHQLEQLPESAAYRALVKDRQVLNGDASTVITKYAADHHMDVIVMGTHNRSGVKHLLLGSVTEGVVRKAECPVLTVPAAVVTPSAAEGN